MMRSLITKRILIVFIILVTGAVVIIGYVSQKGVEDRDNVPIPGLIVGTDVGVFGTVIQNVTEYAAIDGPAYLVVLTDDGANVSVVYSEGDAECKNGASASVGFSMMVGDRVAVYGKAVSTSELATCESTDYYIKKLMSESGR